MREGIAYIVFIVVFGQIRILSWLVERSERQVIESLAYGLDYAENGGNDRPS